jgi:nitroreductase
MFEKRAITSVPIADVLALRWSGRAYDRRRPVPREHLLALAEAARWAPSCFGDQPWRYIVCDRSDDDSAWQRAFECLAEGNQSWARNAPVLMLAIADSLFVHNGKPNRWGQYDCGAASMSLCVQAAGMGLMVHQMGGFDPDRARASFAIPERYMPIAMIAVGYQMAEDDIPDELREREHAARERRAIGQSFFAGHWGNALTP